MKQNCVKHDYTPKSLRNTPFSDSVRLKFDLTLFLFCNLLLEGYLAVTLLIGRYINEPRLTPTHPLRKENYNFDNAKRIHYTKERSISLDTIPLENTNLSSLLACFVTEDLICRSEGVT